MEDGSLANVPDKTTDHAHLHAAQASDSTQQPNANQSHP
jgi:hypothetical protein